MMSIECRREVMGNVEHLYARFLGGNGACVAVSGAIERDRDVFSPIARAFGLSRHGRDKEMDTAFYVVRDARRGEWVEVAQFVRVGRKVSA